MDDSNILGTAFSAIAESQCINYSSVLSQWQPAHNSGPLRFEAISTGVFAAGEQVYGVVDGIIFNVIAPGTVVFGTKIYMNIATSVLTVTETKVFVGYSISPAVAGDLFTLKIVRYSTSLAFVMENTNSRINNAFFNDRLTDGSTNSIQGQLVIPEGFSFLGTLTNIRIYYTSSSITGDARINISVFFPGGVNYVYGGAGGLYGGGAQLLPAPAVAFQRIFYDLALTAGTLPGHLMPMFIDIERTGTHAADDMPADLLIESVHLLI